MTLPQRPADCEGNAQESEWAQRAERPVSRRKTGLGIAAAACVIGGALWTGKTGSGVSQELAFGLYVFGFVIAVCDLLTTKTPSLIALSAIGITALAGISGPLAVDKADPGIITRTAAIGGFVMVLGALVWFLRRRRGGHENPATSSGTESIAAVPSSALQTFAANLQRLREQAGLTREALESCTGVGTSTVSRYEAAQRDPSVTDLARLADGLNVPAAALVEGIPNGA
jgi:hypothetical protein